MTNVRLLSEMVGAIYDSAIDPAKWPMFFRMLDVEAKMDSGGLFVIEPATKQVRYSVSWGVAPDTLRAIETDHGADPTMTFMYGLADPGRDPDEPIVYRQAFDDAFLAKSALYTNISERHQMADAIATLALARPGRLGFLAAVRTAPADVFGPREVELMRLLAPHVRRAVTISDLLDMQTVEVNALTSTLDALRLGVVLVDGQGRILHANRAAKEMLDAHAPINSAGGLLTAIDPEADSLLKLVIAAAERRPLLAGQSRGVAEPISGVPLKTLSGAAAMAHVLPLGQGAVRPLGNPVAAVFVSTADMDASGPLEGIAAMYGLTVGEQRILVEIAKGVGLADAANAAGVSENTAKTHLSRIYTKTGTHRQAELVALLARLTPPLK
jgi:DNA-binding CsgD family transcriptional regulator/PAS domain-containing protein